MTMNMRFFIIAAAATLLAACTQENEVQNNPVEARITAGVSGPETAFSEYGDSSRGKRYSSCGLYWHPLS